MAAPVITKEISHLKIVTISGEIFYAHGVQPEYRYDQRIEVIRGFAKYFTSLRNPTPIQDAYSTLLWHLFPDFIKSYSFNWSPSLCKKSNGKKRHLYVLRNSQGFIKVGVTSNVKVRIIDLKYEWGGEWEILKVYHNFGSMENYLLDKLMPYLYRIQHRHTKKFSTECFIDCPEVLNTCLNLS
jgi:hypothetical protein